MNYLKINPFIRYAGQHTYHYNKRENSVCYDCRLFYIEQGKGTFFANGQTHLISGNEAIFLPPESVYRFSFSNPSAIKIFILNLDLTDEFSAYSKSFSTATEETFDKTLTLKYDLPSEFQTPIVQKNAFSIRENMIKCIDLFLQKTPYYKEDVSALAKLSLLEILRGQQSDDYSVIQTVLEFVRENYSLPTLTNQTIAERFHYHPNYLNRIIKAYTKKTLHEYLLDYRIQMAKRYLSSTKLSVTLIAEKTGFSSYTYFIRYFNKKTGESPLQYRRSHESIGM